MGSVRQDESHQGGQSRASGYSQGGSWNTGETGGMSAAQSTGTQDVWGAQQPALASLYGQAQQLINGQGAAGRGAAGVAGQAREAWADQLTPGGNPYFERSVQGAINNATQGFNQQVLPGLDARGVGVGQYGGQRDSLARGQAAGDFGRALSNNIAGMYAQQYQGDRALAGQALGMAPQMQGMQTAPLTTAAGIIGAPTVLGQQQSTNTASNYGTQAGGSATSSHNSLNSSNWGASSGTGVGILSDTGK
jgi:hypothetical protein